MTRLVRIVILNIPIVLLASVLLGVSVPFDDTVRTSPTQPWDFRGSGLFTVMMVLLLLSSSGTLRGGVGLVVGFGALLTLFFLVLVELRRQSPVIPVRWFKDLVFSVTSAITILTNLVMYVALYGIPVLLETRRHISVSASGFMLLIFAGVMALISPLGGQLARRRARRGPFLGANGILVVASFILWIGRVAPLSVIGVALALLGVSFAVSNVVLQQMVLELAPPTESGSASGLYSLLRYVGTMASSVVIARAFATAASTDILYVSLMMASGLSFILSFAVPRQKALSTVSR